MTSNDNVAFWQESWRQLKIKLNQGNKSNGDNGRRLKRWNHMAKEFAQITSDEKSNARRSDVVQMLKEKNVLTPGARVLDIGAGPGHWAIAMAATVSHVTALEPAEAMTEILKEQIESKQIENITIDQRTFQEIDIEKENWQGAFDFVFASMTPGIDGPSALDKMMTASRRYCYLSAFSGVGWQKEYDQLWRTLFGRDMGRRANDVIYPFNLLYALGYRPNLEFHFWTRQRLWTRDRAIEHYCLMIEEREELTPEIKEKVVNFVDGRCKDGILDLSQQSCQGIMIWDISQRVGK